MLHSMTLFTTSFGSFSGRCATHKLIPVSVIHHQTTVSNHSCDYPNCKGAPIRHSYESPLQFFSFKSLSRPARRSS